MKLSFRYVMYCYRNFWRIFSGRFGMFMFLFSLMIMYSSNVIVLHRFDSLGKFILIFLMWFGSVGVIIAPDKKIKILCATPFLFYLSYGIIISVVDFSLYTSALIFSYLLIEIIIGIWKRR